jgi:transposase InsO family protein
VKYGVVKANSNHFPVTMMCRLLSVSVSGYYGWRDRPPSSRMQEDAALAKKIKFIFDEEKRRPGAMRITKRLRAEGNQVGRHRVAKIMRANGWRARAAKKYKATTNSNHKLPVSPNLLQQYFEASKPNEKFVTDITYVWTEEGWLYLATVMDLYSRMLVGWAIADRMTSTLVIDALQMALWRRGMPRGVIVHSDRGSQYCSHDYQKLLVEHGLTSSMSKRGDCYDNAAMESWNHSFKVEAIHGEKLSTRIEAKNHVFDYIEVYYNRRRLHSKLGYLSPVNFEAKMVA